MLIEMVCGRRVTASSKLIQTPVDKVFRLGDNDPEHASRVISSQDEAPIITRSDEEVEAMKLSGKDFGNATPFEKNFDLKEICDELKKLGINEFCDEEMINGKTGEKMKGLIFTGVCYYQRLRHMVIDKVHARARGGRTRLTHQPRENFLQLYTTKLKSKKIITKIKKKWIKIVSGENIRN